MVQLINAHTPLNEARAKLADAFDLRFTRTVQKATEGVYARIRTRIPESEWSYFAPLIFEINRQKRITDTIILAHHYQAPQIVHGVADLVGDSVRLAVDAGRREVSTALVCGLHHMAETVKLLNAGKRVLIPDSRARASAATSLTQSDVLAIRSQYPGVPLVAYVTSSAAVKAVSDICCTAGNAAQIADALPSDTVIMVPDQFIAQNTAAVTHKKIVTWAGASQVHGSMTLRRLEEFRSLYPEARIAAHLECPPEVVEAADFSGSNGDLISWIRGERPRQVVLLAERSLADNLASAVPEVELIAGLGFCPQMKRITLENVLWALYTGQEEVDLPEEIADPAEAALRRMLDSSRSGRVTQTATPEPA